MSEHVHEWDVEWRDGYAECILPECKTRLSMTQINDRLNQFEAELNAVKNDHKRYKQLKAENERLNNALIDFVERDMWGGKLKKETQWLVESIKEDALKESK